MAPILLKEFTLNIPIDAFLEAFWLNSQWYERFLVEKLDDVDVTIEEWTSDGNLKQRKVRTFHPSNFSFPGLPSHAESLKTHTMEFGYDHENHRKIIIKELNVFNGIPYADYFTVSTEWIVLSDQQECQVWVYLEVKFHKSTWLQGTIESNTKAELMQVMEKWHEFANVHIRQQSLWEEKKGGDLRDEQSTKKLPEIEAPLDEEDENGEQVSPSPFSRSGESEDDRSNTLSSYISDEEENLFYDCEEGEKVSLMRPSRRTSSVVSLSSAYSYKSLDNLNTLSSNSKKSAKHISVQGESARDLAVQIVETVFVLAEFGVWQVYSFYAYDLKDLFDIEPEKVLIRILNSFLPGWHSPLLVQPDLYGPLLGVFLLPQTLLLSVETARHGCDSTSMLGNAVVVSLLIWVGLAALYRLLAMVVAPSIGIKQCLSILGYSFFSWNLALLCTLPLEHFSHHNSYDYHGPAQVHNVTMVSSAGIHEGESIDLSHLSHAPATTSSILLPMTSLLPLVFLGLPSSIAQGYVFWEHTPPSTMTLAPSSLPSSMQHFASQHPRLIKRVLWVFPKVIAFVLVAGTHYQLLWYMARVFLPGRRQLCRLSALMQPSQYADILTQKDLRVFAQKLLSGRDED